MPPSPPPPCSAPNAHTEQSQMKKGYSCDMKFCAFDANNNGSNARNAEKSGRELTPRRRRHGDDDDSNDYDSDDDDGEDDNNQQQSATTTAIYKLLKIAQLSLACVCRLYQASTVRLRGEFSELRQPAEKYRITAFL